MCIFSCFVRLIVPSKAMLERIQPYFFSFLLVFVCYLKKLRRLFSIIALSSWLRLLFCRFLKYGIKYSFFLLLEYWISIGCVHFAGDPRLRDVSETPSPDFLSQTSTSTYIFSCQDAEIYQFHIFEKLHRRSVKVYSIMFKNI